MAVAITGAEGFTGRYVCAELERRGVQWHSLRADLRDLAAVDAEIAAAPQFDALIHLAAIAFAGGGDWRAFYDVNQIGTFNLLDSVARHRPGIRCVVASSAQVYGSAASGMVDETYVCDPSNHYGISKYAMELGARNWANQIDIIITRPFNYTGVGQESRYLIPKLVDHFKRRCATVELGNIYVQRDFGDVREVAAIYCDLTQVDQSVDIINVASGKLYTISDITGMLSALTGHNIDIEINPSFFRMNEVEVLGCDVQKLRATLPDRIYPDFLHTLKWMLDF
jgi:nucleoside-diphosphate-sugar epimerase